MEVLYGLLYTTGGQSMEGILSSVEHYDPTSDSWTFMEPMTSLHMYHGLAEMDKLLFAIGGMMDASGSGRLSTMIQPAIAGSSSAP